jgi:hypothetical protein
MGRLGPGEGIVDGVGIVDGEGIADGEEIVDIGAAGVTGVANTGGDGGTGEVVTGGGLVVGVPGLTICIPIPWSNDWPLALSTPVATNPRTEPRRSTPVAATVTRPFARMQPTTDLRALKAEAPLFGLFRRETKPIA